MANRLNPPSDADHDEVDPFDELPSLVDCLSAAPRIVGHLSDDADRDDGDSLSRIALGMEEFHGHFAGEPVPLTRIFR